MSNKKIVYQTKHYQVVDARDWKFGYCVSKLVTLPSGAQGYTDVSMSMTKKDAIALADGLEAIYDKQKEER